MSWNCCGGLLKWQDTIILRAKLIFVIYTFYAAWNLPSMQASLILVMVREILPDTKEI